MMSSRRFHRFPTLSRAPFSEDECEERVSHVHSLLNYRCLKEVRIFMPEILESEENLYALFKIWMKENRTEPYPSLKEELRRFQGFKHNVFLIHGENIGPDGPMLGINRFGDCLPSDPSYTIRLTEEQTVEYWQKCGHDRRFEG